MDATAATITTHAPTYSCRQTEHQVRSFSFLTTLYDNARTQRTKSRADAGSDGSLVHRYHADLQPAVGGCEEKGGDVVGVGELQQPLSEPGLVPAGTRTQVWVSNVQMLMPLPGEQMTNYPLVGYRRALMVVRPSTVSEKWESKGSWVLSSSCCRSLTEDHKSSLCQTEGWNEGASRKKQKTKKQKQSIWKPYLERMETLSWPGTS